MPLDTEAVIAQLRLEPHPEGGAYRELFRSPATVTRADGAVRSASTLIWFLLHTGDVSVWHRVASADETWHWVDGGPLELTWITVDGQAHRSVLGAVAAGLQPTAIVPANAWQMARPLDEPVLVQCAVAPGFDFRDFTMLRDHPSIAHTLAATHETLITPATLGSPA
jgi:uncharacterized protein